MKIKFLFFSWNGSYSHMITYLISYKKMIKTKVYSGIQIALGWFSKYLDFDFSSFMGQLHWIDAWQIIQGSCLVSSFTSLHPQQVAMIWVSMFKDHY